MTLMNVRRSITGACRSVEPPLPSQPTLLSQELWHRLLGRPVSEYGRLCHGAGGHEGGHRCRRALMLTCMKRLAVSSRGVCLLMLGSHRHG
jgi:hypothetical protein